MEADSGMLLTASYTEKVIWSGAKTSLAHFLLLGHNTEAAKDDEDMDQQKQADQD